MDMRNGWCPDCLKEVEPVVGTKQYYCNSCDVYYDSDKVHKDKPESKNIKLVKNGCPVCHSDVRGNRELRYYCKRCNILYNEEVVKEHALEFIREEPKFDKPLVREEAATPITHKKEAELEPVFAPEPQIEFVKPKGDGKVALSKIEREKGYLYFVDKKGDVSKVKMARSRSDKGPRMHFKVLVVGVKKEKGYLYYVDKEGDISRSKMKRGEKIYINRPEKIAVTDQGNEAKLDREETSQ